MAESVPIDTPELRVFRNVFQGLIQQNWELGLGVKNNRELSLTVGLPDSLRLLTKAAIINVTDLQDGDTLKTGYTVEHSDSDDRTYISYEGDFEKHVLDTLIGLMQLGENKADDFYAVIYTPPYDS